MVFCWTPEMIRFRIDAAEQVGFDAEIAKRLLPYLQKGAHVCDAGCGLGYLGIALAQAGFRVTAVDESAQALEVLKHNAAKQGLANLAVQGGDLFSMEPGEPYDAMVFCFFGHTLQTLQAIKKQCRGKAFLIKKNCSHHRFALGKRRLEKGTFAAATAELDGLGVPYETACFDVEMGQPFRSLSDAAAFFSIYGKEAAPVSQTQAASRLAPGNSPAFLYYLPANRPLGLIIVNALDIPDTVNGMQISSFQ